MTRAGFATLALAKLCSASTAPSLNEVWPSPTEKFAEYESVFHKTYATKYERAVAFAEFIKNDAIIIEHNAKKLSYHLGHNEFSDQSWDDFAKGHLGLVVNPNRTKVFDDTLDLSGPYAESLDWVTKGAVTKVKNQAMCGSCWSFSTTGAVEGALQIATTKLIPLSEQQLVSCDMGSHGCQGGSMDQALEWIETHPLCTEDEYPYKSGDGMRRSCHSCTGVATVTKFVDVHDETALMAAINKGPVSIAVEADKLFFKQYSGGIFDRSDCGRHLDHGILLVGYGTDSGIGKDYWKIKNSWGVTWGEMGYVRFVRGKDQCGLGDMAVYPTGAKLVKPAPTPSPGPGPQPSPTPSPGPGPSPGCDDDDEDLCKDMINMESKEEGCRQFALICKKSCDCCGPSPPPWCDNEVAFRSVGSSIVV